MKHKRRFLLKHSQKSRPLSLWRSPGKQPGVKVKKQSGFFDSGFAIELQYDDGFYMPAVEIKDSQPEYFDHGELSYQVEEFEEAPCVSCGREVEPAVRELSSTEEEPTISSDTADARAFEEGVRAILSQQKETGLQKENLPGETPEVPGAEEKKTNPHDIFDQMGKSIPFANTYDLGTAEVEQEIPVKTIKDFSGALELDDLDVAQDFEIIEQIQTAKKKETGPVSDKNGTEKTAAVTVDTEPLPDGIEEDEPEDTGYTRSLSETPVDDSFCPENPQETASSPNFKLGEFKCKDGTEVPEKFRGNTQELMDNLEVLRKELGDEKIYITSGYRTFEYNRDVVYKKKKKKHLKSRHVCGMAADIKVENHTPKEVYETIEGLIKEGRMKQGGLHQYNTFVHYDVRGTEDRW